MFGFMIWPSSGCWLSDRQIFGGTKNIGYAWDQPSYEKVQYKNNPQSIVDCAEK